MIYSTNTLQESLQNRERFHSKDTTISDSRLFFIEALDMIIEENKIVSIVEDSVLYEFDIKQSLKDWFNKSSKSFFKKVITGIFNALRKIIEKIWAMFKSFMVSMQSQSVVINKYKDILKNYSEDILYPYEFIEFRNLENAGSLTLFTASVRNLKAEMEDNLNKILRNGTYDSIYSSLNSYKESLITPDEYLSTIRAQITGSYGDVSKQEYSDKLYKFFRGDGSVGENATLDANFVRESYNNYMVNYKKTTDQLNKESNDIKRCTKALENDITRMKISSYTETETTQDLVNQFNYITNNFLLKIKGVCDIYTQFYSAKLDAVRESMIQDKNVLVVAVRKYIENGGEKR